MNIDDLAAEHALQMRRCNGEIERLYDANRAARTVIQAAAHYLNKHPCTHVDSWGCGPLRLEEELARYAAW